MKKSIRWTAMVSGAAFIAAAAPVLTISPLADEIGWKQENETWRYYDSDGYVLTDSWRKSADDWYYLDENGEMASDRQIEEYYVDKDGKRVSSTWVSVKNEDVWDLDAPDSYWYYYAANGKYVAGKFKTIDDATYYFDEEGHMVTGLMELDGANYCFGSDGAMKKGWVQLPAGEDELSDEMVWCYFDSQGKRVENQVDRHIGGGYYTFADGIMITGWYKLPEETATASPADAQEAGSGTAESVKSSSPAAGYQYYDHDGKRASGWQVITGIPGVSSEDETYRFYFRNGVPYFAETGIKIFSIGSDRYAFNEKGEMLTGRQSITLEDGSSANYYFGENGSMKTGRQSIFDEDTQMQQTWYFNTDGSGRGQGFSGIRNNTIYENGLRKEADADLRYSPVEFENGSYLVNAVGTIQKASSTSRSSSRPELGTGYRDIRDANDTVWTVNVNGIIQ